jgi:hypothetical protein
MESMTEREIREAYESLKKIVDYLEETTLDALQKAFAGPEFFDLRRAAEKKGEPYRSLATRPWRQPLAGFSRDRDGRKRYWPRQEVERWAQAMSVDDRLEYLREKLYCGDREIEAGVLSVLQTYAADEKLPEAERMLLDEVTEERYVRA